MDLSTAAWEKIERICLVTPATSPNGQCRTGSSTTWSNQFSLSDPSAETQKILNIINTPERAADREKKHGNTSLDLLYAYALGKGGSMRRHRDEYCNGTGKMVPYALTEVYLMGTTPIEGGDLVTFDGETNRIIDRFQPGTRTVAILTGEQHEVEKIKKLPQGVLRCSLVAAYKRN
ncbi:MAG: hypothetical protein OXR66_04825 [Candidatus Woesearchaeota archaeon]|nr:hypothetical protein [Candidatus Woesearchaeota archaeon]